MGQSPEHTLEQFDLAMQILGIVQVDPRIRDIPIDARVGVVFAEHLVNVAALGKVDLEQYLGALLEVS